MVEIKPSLVTVLDALFDNASNNAKPFE